MNQRNGYRERAFETRLGTLDLRIPKLRSRSYFPSFLEPRKASGQALVAVVQEAYVKGISTRKVDDLMQALAMTGVSKSQISRLCAELDQRVAAFLNRKIRGQWPYLWLDATYVKSRERGSVDSQAVVVAVAVNAEGRRETLGMAVGPAETDAFGTDLLRGLMRRGLSRVWLVISDAHEGLKQAKLSALMDGAGDDALAFMGLPKEHWPQLASTNPLERLNKETKRRSRVIGIFPNNAAVMRLAGTLLAEQTDEWLVTRR